ncbi:MULTISPECIES: hypothetical protein [unclassified Microcoleus]|uniref:hypothetical protein n=1 Tax=unclassified Microcoleus TaxID=2642155 RepID=UPI002FCED3A6
MAAAIEFKLFASNNKAATLLGSFSQWAEIPLKKDKKMTNVISALKFRALLNQGRKKNKLKIPKLCR